MRSGQSKMGMCYMRGVGVPKDCVTAWMWFDLAAAQTTWHDLICNCDMRDTLAALDLTPAQIAGSPADVAGVEAGAVLTAEAFFASGITHLA